MLTRAADEARRKMRLDVLEAMLLLENERGHLGWKVSDLARAAGVTRTLVYYHFGRTKQAILDAGIELLAEEYFGLTAERESMLRAGKAWESVMLTREMILVRPSFAVFYLRWRLQPRSSLATKLAKIERRYQAMLERAFPKLSKDRILALHAILHGVVTAPFLTEEAFAEIRRLVRHLGNAEGRG